MDSHETRARVVDSITEVRERVLRPENTTPSTTSQTGGSSPKSAPLWRWPKMEDRT